MFRHSWIRNLVFVCLAMAACLPFAGCNSFGNGQLVQELRHENERLLTEFRAERDRREQSEKTLRLVESRLEESEKLLAKHYQGTSASRLTRRPPKLPSGATGSGQLPFSADLPGVGGRPAADPDTGLRWERRIEPQQ